MGFASKLALILSVLLMTFWGQTAPASGRYGREIRSALEYIESQQVSKTGSYDPGQWPTLVTATLFSRWVGIGHRGEPTPEATVFTAASIVNILSEMYLQDPSLEKIPPIVDRAVASFPLYYEKGLFNFYPLKNPQGPKERSPRTLRIPFYIKRLANIPEDADTTSTVYVALNYQRLLKSPRCEKKFLIDPPPLLIQSLSRYRDQNRRPHYYNFFSGYRNTGAFLTWLAEEGWGSKIPFSRNDVDCVVNANVLRLLTWMDRTSGPGYKSSCQYLKQVIAKQQYGGCGIYYPTDFYLPVIIGSLAQLQAPCLNAADENELVKYLLRNQYSDGSWKNREPHRPDKIQSTALAVNALLLLGDPQNKKHRHAIGWGLYFLRNQAQRDGKGRLYWPGEVFFSAVAQARYSVVWRSNAFTTALIAYNLLLAEEFLS